MIKGTALAVFVLLFAFVTILGFWAARWRRGDLTILHEWGLAGGRFGTIVSWFLLGGDLYTAYTFIAIPGLVFGAGALGFFAVPYTVIVYPFVFVVMPRFWTMAKRHGYLTTADFVQGRFGSRGLALAITATGILATMPYIALQMFGIEVSIAQMGVPVEISLTIAFVILAAYTYFSGLRAPALIAVVKDVMIWLVVIVSVLVIPARLGGIGKIFAAAGAAKKALVITPVQYSGYASLAFGSALALFLYPHIVTGVLSTNSRQVIRRNAALLPAYSFLLGLIALLGYMAVAANVKVAPPYGANGAVPALISQMFPEWWAGFAFAAISIGALVPASIMSIGAANLFSRNVYREFFRPNATPLQESNVAKIASLVVKLGALLFILFLPTQYAVELQLLGGVWVLQTLPALILGLYSRWLHRWALLVGWAAGMVVGTGMAAVNNFGSLSTLNWGGHVFTVYPGLLALLVNLVLCGALTPVFLAMGIPRGTDATAQRPGAAPTLGVAG